MKTFLFNSQIQLGPKLGEFTLQEIKNEPMIFNGCAEFAYEKGSEITRDFIDTLPDDWKRSPDLVIDSRVHMLMPDWYPCIPGFHHDDVPRERSDGQPNYDNPSYKSEHCLALIGDCCLTEFAIGEAHFPDVPLGEKYYKVWHPMVKKLIEEGELESVMAPHNRLVFFDWQTWHQGTKATKNGWRWFGRASRKTGRTPTNEIRRQTQVYLDAPMEGW